MSEVQSDSPFQADASWLDQYPLEVLEVVLAILKAQSKS
jgi:hypothetical protein